MEREADIKMTNTLQNLTNNVLSSFSRLFALFLLLIIALKWPFFSLPPVWDEAFSIFPAADFLVKHDFNYSLFSIQPRYLDGGPTQHGFSLLTLITALVLKITGGGTWAWVILHAIQWLMAAAIGTMLTRIYRNIFEEITAFLLALVTLVYPLMLAQLGTMYIEVPLLFFSVSAFYFFCNKKIWMASLSLLAACITKESGAVAVGALILTAFSSQDNPLKIKIKNILILAVPSAVAVLILLIIVDMRLSYSISHSLQEIFNLLIHRNFAVYRHYISFVPELIIIFIGSILLSIILIAKYFHENFKIQPKLFDIILYNSYFVLLFLIFHFIFHAYMQMTDSHFLTRYFFYAIPSMFLILYYPIDKILMSLKIKRVLLLVILGIFLINRSGMLYPPIPFSSIAMAERSEEYIDGYKVQKEYIGMIERDVPKDIPVYVSLPDYFLMHYAVSGYVQEPLPNVHFIGHTVKAAGNKFNYPDHFILVYHYPWLGGQYIKKIVQEISGSREFSVEVLGSFKKGNFNAHVFEIKNCGIAKPSEKRGAASNLPHFSFIFNLGRHKMLLI